MSYRSKFKTELSSSPFYTYFSWTESVCWDTRVLTYGNEYDGEVILREMSLPLTQLVLSTNHPKAELLFFSCVPVRITSPSYSFSYLSTLVSQRTDSVQVNVAEVSSFTIYHSTLSCHHSFHVYRQSRECLSDSLNSLFSYITE